MTFDLNTCRYVVWGMKPENNHYSTHSHVHHAIFRALKHLRPNSLWLDSGDDLSGINFENTLFISEHNAAKRGIPISSSSFYVVHGLNDDPDCRELFQDYKRLSWNVFHDTSHVYNSRGNPFFEKSPPPPLTDQIWLAEDTPFYPNERHMDFRWATDLLPHEIEANKPKEILGKYSRVIWWVGTQWHVNQKELNEFSRACYENGIEFKCVGAGQNGVVSIEENIRLVRESFFAPAISGSHHLTEGYAPCRIFKNISYGQMGITNSARVNQLFGGDKLIFHPDPYELFYHARATLKDVSIEHLHMLMDEVAQKHTYLNRLENVFKAVRFLEGQ